MNKTINCALVLVIVAVTAGFTTGIAACKGQQSPPGVTGINSVSPNNVPNNSSVASRSSDPAARTDASSTMSSSTTTGVASDDRSATLSASSSSTTQPSSGTAFSDTAITAKVKTALIEEKNLTASDIHVDTHNSEVRLSGKTRTQDQADRAVQVALGVSGVHGVDNQIAINP